MHVAVKPVITSGLALVGASVIAVAPIAPVEAPAPDVRVVDSDVSLTASSLGYVPINMVQQALNAPANMVAALERFATALAISGSWNDNHANNQWGWDEANPAMLREMINTMVPFPAFSGPWGHHLNWWAAANLPMYAGCNYDCPDPLGMAARMFRVPMSEFYDEDGYTFPVVITPFNGEPTPWSETTVKLDPAEPITSLWNSLTAEPTGIQTTTLWEMVTAMANFGAALQITGHMPDWIAVREIETFVKHFLRPPAEEETPESDTEVPELSLVSSASAVEENSFVNPSPTSTLRTLRSVDTAASEEPAEEARSADSSNPVASPVPSEKPDLVETVTNELKKKFASVAAPKSDDDDDADDDDESPAAEDADKADDKAAEDKAADDEGGKHRKADDTAASDTSSGTSDSGGSTAS